MGGAGTDDLISRGVIRERMTPRLAAVPAMTKEASWRTRSKLRMPVSPD